MYGQYKHGTVSSLANFDDRKNEMNCVEITMPVGQNKIRNQSFVIGTLSNIHVKPIGQTDPLRRQTTGANYSSLCPKVLERATESLLLSV